MYFWKQSEPDTDTQELSPVIEISLTFKSAPERRNQQYNKDRQFIEQSNLSNKTNREIGIRQPEYIWHLDKEIKRKEEFF